jgi:hypothetical protein
MKKFLFLLVAVAVLSVPCFAQRNSASLTISEKAQIIESILVSEDLPDRDLIVSEKNDGRIFLSTENIVSLPLPEIEGISFVLLDRKKIKQTKTDYGFYRFGSFSQDGQYIKISFGRYFKPNDEWNGEGTLYRCKKLSRWICCENAGFSRRVE